MIWWDLQACMMPIIQFDSLISRGSCVRRLTVAWYWGNVLRCGKLGFTVNRGVVNRGSSVYNTVYTSYIPNYASKLYKGRWRWGYDCNSLLSYSPGLGRLRTRCQFGRSINEKHSNWNEWAGGATAFVGLRVTRTKIQQLQSRLNPITEVKH